MAGVNGQSGPEVDFVNLRSGIGNGAPKGGLLVETGRNAPLTPLTKLFFDDPIDVTNLTQNTKTRVFHAQIDLAQGWRYQPIGYLLGISCQPIGILVVTLFPSLVVEIEPSVELLNLIKPMRYKNEPKPKSKKSICPPRQAQMSNWQIGHR